MPVLPLVGDNLSTRLERSVGLSRLDHSQRDTVFYAAAGVEIFHFSHQTGFQVFRFFHVSKFNEGSVSHQLGQIFINLSH